jgi:hypothetical protein
VLIVFKGGTVSKNTKADDSSAEAADREQRQVISQIPPQSTQGAPQEQAQAQKEEARGE